MVTVLMFGAAFCGKLTPVSINGGYPETTKEFYFINNIRSPKLMFQRTVGASHLDQYTILSYVVRSTVQ